MTLEAGSGQLLAGPDIVSRGFAAAALDELRLLVLEDLSK